MGVGAVPWSKIVQYGEFHEMSKDQIYFMVEAIRVIDRKFLHYQAKKAKEAMIKNKK